MRRLPRPGNELGRFSEEGVLPRLGYEGDHLPLLDDRPGIGDISRVLVDREGLARHGGLVHGQVVAFEELNVGGYDVAQAQADDVPGDEVLGVCLMPFAAASDARLERELAFKGVYGVRGLVLLPETHQRVEDQKHGYDDEIVPVPYYRRKDGRDLYHPGDGPPEVQQELQDRVDLFLGERVGTVFTQPASGLFLLKSGVGRPELFHQFFRGRRLDGVHIHGAEGSAVRFFSHRQPRSFV